MTLMPSEVDIFVLFDHLNLFYFLKPFSKFSFRLILPESQVVVVVFVVATNPTSAPVDDNKHLYFPDPNDLLMCGACDTSWIRKRCI